MSDIDLDKYRAAAMAAVKSDDNNDTDEAKPVEDVKPVEKPAQDAEPATSGASGSAEDKPEDSAVDDEPAGDSSEELEPKEEAQLEGSLDDYLPPEGFSSEPELEQEPELAEDPRVQELQRQIDDMKQRAAQLDVDLEPPKLVLDTETLQELEDTSPAVANAVIAMARDLENLKRQTASKTEPADNDTDDQAEAMRRARLVQEQAIKSVPNLDYWFNYPLTEGQELPEHIKAARDMASDIDAELIKDPEFADMRKRFQEVAKRTEASIKKNLDRAVTRSQPSMTAAPGSVSEGGVFERLKGMPASERLKALNDLPADQQREYKDKIFAAG